MHQDKYAIILNDNNDNDDIVSNKDIILKD